MPAGELILPGSEFGNEIGFTAGLFSSDSGFIRYGDVVEMAFIKSTFPGRGNFLKILANLKSKGYNVKVLQPSFQMQKILRRQGFRRSRKICRCINPNVYSDKIEYCTTWYIPKKRVVKDVKA